MSKPHADDIFERLCVKDPRNPCYNDFMWDEDNKPDPNDPTCSCDNCFYGRTTLAKEILRLREVNSKLRVIVKQETFHSWKDIDETHI